MKRSVDDFCENPFWNDYYTLAPSENCRRYVALEFYYSDDPDEEEEVVEEIKRLESQLDLDDWKHLLKYCGNNPRYAYIKNKIDSYSSSVKIGNNVSEKGAIST